ncbi:MAG: hypothetical protein K0R65_2075 [Crocinitomicaceae bacterium]|jgi:hypothetical protein|nr:hypothetical protein [Crocinitomicaceae bacterium]
MTRITPVLHITQAYLAFFLPIYIVFLAFFIPYLRDSSFDDYKLLLYIGLPLFTIFCVNRYFTFYIVYTSAEGFVLKRLFSSKVHKIIPWDKVIKVIHDNFLVFSTIELTYKNGADLEKIIKFKINKFNLSKFRTTLREHQLTLS